MESSSHGCQLMRENWKAKPGRKDETERGWMKNIKRVTNMGIKQGRPGIKSLWEIEFYQKSTVPLIPMKVFCHLVREIGQSIKGNIRWQSTAIFTLQNGARDLHGQIDAWCQFMCNSYMEANNNAPGYSVGTKNLCWT